MHPSKGRLHRWVRLISVELTLAYALFAPSGFVPAAAAVPSDALTLTVQARDIFPPQAITDLAAAAGAEGQVLLTWTAPREDNVPQPNLNPVAQYIVRFSADSVITAGSTTTWWNTAQDIAGEPSPQARAAWKTCWPT